MSTFKQLIVRCVNFTPIKQLRNLTVSYLQKKEHVALMGTAHGVSGSLTASWPGPWPCLATACTPWAKGNPPSSKAGQPIWMAAPSYSMFTVQGLHHPDAPPALQVPPLRPHPARRDTPSKKLRGTAGGNQGSMGEAGWAHLPAWPGIPWLWDDARKQPLPCRSWHCPEAPRARS